MGNIRCLNCGNDITMISGSVCPNCNAHLSHVKISFLAYLGSEDSLSGYQRSYKLVLLKSLFEELLSNDTAYVKSVVARFRQYYSNRIAHGLIPDKDVDDRIKNIQESSLEDVFSVIKVDPYNAIHKHNFLSISDEGLNGHFILQSGISDLNNAEKESLILLMEAKLRLYYNKIGSTVVEKENEDNQVATVTTLMDEAGSGSVISYPSLEEIGLSTRAYNALRQHRIQTVERLLEILENGEIANVRNLGSNSINEIYRVVENLNKGTFSKSSKAFTSSVAGKTDIIGKYFPGSTFVTFRNYCSKQGIDSVQKLKSIDVSELIKVRGFGLSKCNAIRKRISEIVLLEEIKQPEQVIPTNDFEKIHPSNEFLQIGNLCGFGIPSNVVKSLADIGVKTFSDLKKESKSRILQLLGLQNFTKLKSVLLKFESPIVDLAVSCFQILEQEKQFDLFVCRSRGETFQEVGDRYGLTRERVRQLCCKFEKKVAPIMFAIAQMLEEANEDHYIREEQILSVFTNDTYNKICVHVLKTSSQYKNIGGIYFNQEYYPRVELELEDIIDGIVGDGINLFEEIERIEGVLDNSGYGFLSIDDFFNCVIKFNYAFYGDYIVKNKRSYAFLCVHLVEEFFPNGIKNEIEDINRLRGLVLKHYGNLELPDNDRSLWTRLCSYLVQCGRSTYISPKQIVIDKDLLEEIKLYVDQSPLSEIFFKEIFAEFEGILMMTTNIDNAAFLHGVFVYYYPHEYIYSRDSLTKRDVEETDSLASRIRDVLQKAGGPLRKDSLLNNFPGLPEYMLLNAISHSNDIMQWEYNYFNCMCNITIDEVSKALLKQSIEVLLSANQGYCSEGMLYAKTVDLLQDCFKKNKVSNAQNLFYLASMLLNGEFSFRRPHIALNGRFKTLNIKDVLIELLGDPDRMYYDQFAKLSANLMIPTVTAGMVFADIEKSYIRISQNEYLRTSCISFDTSNIEQIKDLIESCVGNKWYLPLQKLSKSQDRLSNGIEINEFVMESLVNELDLGWRVVQPLIKDRRYQKGILVRSNNPIITYDALVASALLDEGYSELSESQLLSFMQIHQLAGKVVPKELFSSPHFDVDENGTIRVY